MRRLWTCLLVACLSRAALTAGRGWSHVAAILSVLELDQDRTYEPVYKAVGQKVVLTPDSGADPITSVTWKYGLDIAMAWHGGETDAYRHFKDRGMLNSSTGALTITGLTRDDSGSYTVQINNSSITKTTQLLVISRVSKPSVSTWCEPEMSYCLFTCEGNTTDAEPIEYLWSASDISRLSSAKVYNLTKEEKEPLFSCSLGNPVSFKTSEEARNPFAPRKWKLMLIIILIIAVLLLMCILLVIVVYRKVKDVKAAAQERLEMLPDGRVTPWVQAVVKNNNATERLSVICETSDQDPTCALSPDTCDETENSAGM